MAHIVPKLNLNKIPQLSEDNSLTFAKNVRALVDKSITNDTSIDTALTSQDIANYYGNIVGNNGKIYIFCNYAQIVKTASILEYDEKDKSIREIECNWSYHGGTITGCCTTNITGEYILVICESNATEDVPIKYINLSKCSYSDDESVYTENPNIPFTQLILSGNYTCNIPNGTYQFFIRYKIRENFYTQWFPASIELFASNQTEYDTVTGTVTHCDLRYDCVTSFIFDVHTNFQNITANYDKFQIGFILSSQDTTVARSWKEFSFDTTKIYFDYNENSIKEVNIDDMLKTHYELFNVQNVAFHKEKLFISNYKETDFNPDLTNYAQGIETDFSINKISQANTFINGISLLRSSSSISYYDIWDNSNIENLFNSDFVDKKTVLQQQSNISSNNIDIECSFNRVNIGSRYSSHGGWNCYASDMVAGIRIYRTKEDRLQNRPYTYPVLQQMQFHYVNNLRTQDVKLVKERLQVPDAVLHEVVITTTSGPIYLIGNGNNTNEDINNVRYFYGIGLFASGIFENYAKVSENLIKECVIQLVAQNIKGIDNSGNFYALNPTSNNIETISSIQYNFTHLNIRTALVIGNDINTVCIYAGNSGDSIASIYKEFTITTSVKFDGSIDEGRLENTRTLMPFTDYEFYAHFVKQNGIETNGYKIGDFKVLPEIACSDNEYLSIQPKFSNIHIPDGYCGCFVTYNETHDTVVRLTVTGAQYVDENGVVYDVFTALECNTLNVNVNKNLNIYINNNNSGNVSDLDLYSDKGEYISSGNSDISSLFAMHGIILVPEKEDPLDPGSYIPLPANKDFYIRIKKENKNNYATLIRLTQYLFNDSYISDLNLPGFVTRNKELSYNLCKQYYLSGSDVYTKGYASISGGGNPPTPLIPGTNQDDYLGLDLITSDVPIQRTSGFIYKTSCFNLNCVSFNDDITDNIRSYETDDGQGNVTMHKQVIKAINSLTSSSVLTLTKQFSTYNRKSYYIANRDNTMLVFNNTIRSSDVNTDEEYRNIYTFKAEEYYNVPCDRGIIINMFAVLNNIYVHTEHSLYKFSSNAELKTTDEETLEVRETNPFNMGITEVFDSQHGHGGLQVKHSAIVIYEGYIYYDYCAKELYYYNSETSTIAISDPIRKLLDEFEPNDVVFAADPENNRLFINLKHNADNICLSYNFKIKGFISVHDIDFNESISTRFASYLIKVDSYSIDSFSLGKIVPYITDVSGNKQYNVYKNFCKISHLSVNDEGATGSNGQRKSIIDIITNSNYEYIKVLEYVKWIAFRYVNYGFSNTNQAESNNEVFGGNKIRIYTDRTSTNLIDITDSNNNTDKSNNYALTDVNSYKKPRFNDGVWSINYFRDILQNNTENSLIYGKYCIFRIVFDNNNFVIENVTFKLNNYDKVF